MRLAASVLLALALVPLGASAAPRPTDRWNLEDLFPTAQKYDEARAAFSRRLGELERHRGRLGRSAEALSAGLDLYFGLRRELHRLQTYAMLRADEDTRAAPHQARKQESEQLAADHEAKSAWLAPELLALPAGTLTRFGAAPQLAQYRHFLADLERQRAHTLPAAEEKLLAEIGPIAGAPTSIYGILSNADLPVPTVTLSDGKRVRLDQPAYTMWRAATSRADRAIVFREFWRSFRAFENTFGTVLDAQVRKDVILARARRYPNALAAALDGANVPEAVYRTLVAEANRALPTLHRALALRARLLGVKDLGYHDAYTALVPGTPRRYTIDEAEAIVVAAVAPLGPAYAAAVKQGFSGRWMDVYPQPGKRSGAYCEGAAYDVHPYVLMNWNGDHESLTVLAHEWGHAIHSHLANRTQPFPNADYATFTAEVASTFNEALLFDHLYRRATRDDERLFLLGTLLESLRSTFFRQAMFAEFELRIHELAEGGTALTGERLSAEYLALLRRYMGHEKGVMRIDDAYGVEWAYVHHFYMGFYVFQYATSLAAASLLSAEVLAGKPGAADRYLGLLSAGGSDYAYDMLKRAGVDLATPAPYRALEARMRWALEEIEKLAAKRAR